MKGFIKVHAATANDDSSIDSIILPLQTLESCTPAGTFTAMHYPDGSAYRVTETIDQIEELINNAI